MLCFQLFVNGDNLGALNLYGEDVDVFDEESEQVGLLVGAHAAVAFSDAQEIGQLNLALDTRDLIGQAKGILMERFKITSQQAFQVLTRASSETETNLGTSRTSSPAVERFPPVAANSYVYFKRLSRGVRKLEQGWLA